MAKEETTDHFIFVKGAKVYFIFNYMFGPFVTDGIGNPTDRQPTAQRDPFFGPFAVWLSEYSKMNPDKPRQISSEKPTWPDVRR